MQMKIVVPARYNSSRLPGKPLLPLAGKPVFVHVIERIIGAGFPLEDVILATDDQRIVESANSYNIPVMLTSDKHPSGSDRINEVAQQLGWNDHTIVINVQGDEPLIPSALISELAKFVSLNSKFDMCTLATSISDMLDYKNQNIVKVVHDINNKALYFSRAMIPFCRDGGMPSRVLRHIGIYAYRVASLKSICELPVCELENTEKLEQLRVLYNGMSIGVATVKQAPPHGVDTYDDYLKIKSLLGDI